MKNRPISNEPRCGVSADPLKVPGLVAFWDFQAAEGEGFVSQGACRYRLHECGGSISPVADGVFGAQAIRLGDGGWLRGLRADCPALNYHGPQAKFTVVAWIKRHRGAHAGCEAVAGMWNEHGMRQYCLFLNLRIHGSAEQVGAHVSAHGGATPGEKYCMEAAIGATAVPLDIWQCVAMTYDGVRACAWLDGRADLRGDRNPLAHPDGIFDGGPAGADFTVGAVLRPEWVDEERNPHGTVMANRYQGLLGGLAVFDRDLTAWEIQALGDNIHGK